MPWRNALRYINPHLFVLVVVSLFIPEIRPPLVCESWLLPHGSSPMLRACFSARLVASEPSMKYSIKCLSHRTHILTSLSVSRSVVGRTKIKSTRVLHLYLDCGLTVYYLPVYRCIWRAYCQGFPCTVWACGSQRGYREVSSILSVALSRQGCRAARNMIMGVPTGALPIIWSMQDGRLPL